LGLAALEQVTAAHVQSALVDVLTGGPQPVGEPQSPAGGEAA